MRPARHSLLVAATSLTLLSGARASAQKDELCKKVVDATLALVKVDHSQIAKSNQLVMEGLTVAGVSYVKLDGKWSKSPISLQKTTQMIEEMQKGVKVRTCARMPDEEIDGESALVVRMHQESELGTTDSTTWLSKRTNLPLKTESDALIEGVKSHMSSRVGYKNIKAPPGL